MRIVLLNAEFPGLYKNFDKHIHQGWFGIRTHSSTSYHVIS